MYYWRKIWLLLWIILPGPGKNLDLYESLVNLRNKIIYFIFDWNCNELIIS